MASFETAGTRFELRERGSGAPVVLVHGSASDLRTWDGALDRLGERCRVVAYSRRYHWPNQRIAGAAPYTLAQHDADLEALLGALELSPAHLVGHSYGALVCLALAVRAPHLVRSLVLCEPPALRLFTSDPPRPAELLRLLFTRPRTGLAVVKLGASGLGPATAAARRGDDARALALFGTAALGRDAFRRLAPERLEQARANYIAAELLADRMPPLDLDPIRGLALPALLVSGARSPRAFHRIIERLEELLPRAERVDIAGASHIVHEDAPVAFAAAVLPFLLR